MSRLALVAFAALSVTYQPPVDAPVVDPFRAPASHYGAGNRGLEYATAPGTSVRAIGNGTVVFAGPVAGRLYVTVLHEDGLRSSYSYLQTIGVGRGDRVTLGQQVGRAGPRLHLGVRSGDQYLDPAALFDLSRPAVRLVPLPGPPPAGRGAALGAVLGARLRATPVL